VEAKFLAKASSMGFGVARPWATERYDFILDHLVAYCVPEDLWYIVPIKKFIGKGTLFF
jgi:hypothetical protein